ncbi:MAG: hypothetical protein JXR37_01610 [Kiritimatiellae bacterium]|nr:hypothetical protein [Kiritimatiellia bacterium]
MSVAVLSSKQETPALILRDLKDSHGLARVDLGRFWDDQRRARSDPFGADIPQVPLGVMMGSAAVYDELDVAEDEWRYRHDEQWRLELNRAYNDKAEALVGRRLLDERPADPSKRQPAVKQLHDVFEARNVWHSGCWWLQQAAGTPDELEALLDRVAARDIRRFILPGNWEEEKARMAREGIRLPRYRGQRGPVTFAMSVYGVENLIFLILDRPELAARFRDAILAAMLEIARVLDEEAGYTPETAPRGFSFCDDNSALLTPQMYEFFGYPILKGIWDRYSPDPGDSRYQHSDSAMGHLLPVLGRLNLTGTNFGPTLTVAEIREHLPRAVIHGQLAPFTFSRNEEEKIVAEFLRDFEMAQETRGLVFATAGSVNNGSRLTGMRLIMSLIQHHGRYDP